MTSAPFQVHHEPGLPWTGVRVSLLTTSAFFLLNAWLKRTGMTQPATTGKDAQLSWRWRNILLSLIHSLISGIWTIYCALTQPSLMPGGMDTRSQAVYTLACFSNGYFAYDLVEMLIHVRERGCLELVVHHLFVVSCLMISVVHRQFLGFACMALAVEVSNVFLHARHLMKIAGWEKTRFYAAHRWINLAFFVMFRVVVMFFLVYCMYVYQSVVPYWVFTAGMVSGSVVLLMSASLMHRLIRSDFGPSASNYSNAWSSSNAAAAVAVDGRQERTSGSTTTAAGGDQMSAQMSGDDPVLRPGSLSSPTSHSLSSKKIC